MAKREYKVSTVDGMVRMELGDGEWVDFMPDQANKLSGLLARAAHEAVYNDRPSHLTLTFNFDD